MKIIYTRPDGGLSVVSPRKDRPEDVAVKQAFEKLPPDAINPEIVDDSVVPKDRTFRNAWKAEAGGIVHDMQKCREIHRNYLRELRGPKMKDLDIAFMRAIETGASASDVRAIVAKKQALRDVTNDAGLLSAETPEALKAVMPDALLV